MNISLTPELEAYIASKVESGGYRSASEVVREGLRLLEEQDQLKQLRRERLRQLIDEGMTDLSAGRSTVLDEEEMRALKAEARANASALKK
ncbi:MAG: type II toxin-antitoxin system ParD family antitoxin [Deltaproteobacteria bacterium]|nr:MAG: type II toxin-antitoxin system ParD family antitoxin [Deltaproteobacteria bacterium]